MLPFTKHAWCVQAQISTVDQVLETNYLFQLFVISPSATDSLAALLHDRIETDYLLHTDI